MIRIAAGLRLSRRSIYDIFEDFMSRMEGESGPDYNPTKAFDSLRWSSRRARGASSGAPARESFANISLVAEVLFPPLHSIATTTIPLVEHG